MNSKKLGKKVTPEKKTLFFILSRKWSDLSTGIFAAELV